MDYEQLVEMSAEAIEKIGDTSEEMDLRCMAELYQIYYNALAGVLRSGALYAKEMGKDGYTRLSISVGTKTHSCRESILRDILKDDYERLSRYPYENTSLEMAKPYLKGSMTAPVITASPSQQDTSKKDTLKEEQILEEEKRKTNAAAIREKNKQLQKAAKRFKYNPDYDHNYDDKLPEILKELASTKRVTARRIFAIAAAALIMVCSLMFL